MHHSRRTLGYALAATLAAASALGQPAAGAPNASSPVDQAMMAGMTKMNHDMATAPMTGDPDRDFVAMMIPHHQGAIAMARAELEHGKNPAMRRLARNIIAAQDREIGEMHRWQASHGAS